MESNEEKYIQMREYSRVDAVVPLEVRLVPPQEIPGIRSRTSIESVMADLQALPELDDKVVWECLKILNAKLDTLIKMLTFQTRDYCSLQLTSVNVSAGGLGATLREEFLIGDVVEVRMMFPTILYVVFYIYGEVVRTEKLECGGYQTSIEFTAIDEDIRDKIAKFVFERQREILRKRRQ